MPVREHGLFQSDHDLDLVTDLSHEAGLTKLVEDARASAKAQGKSDKDVNAISYTIYRGNCSDPDLVREHLDSGVLVEMIAKYEDKMLAPTGSQHEMERWLADPCYVYVLLGACAMTLGCHLPETYVSMLRKVYTEGGLMAGSRLQLRKALFGPDGYKNGEPYDFESGFQDLKVAFFLRIRKESEFHGPDLRGMEVFGPGRSFSTGMPASSNSDIIKELSDQRNKPDACGGCGVEQNGNDKPLLKCARCMNRKYCSRECQRTHWKKIHQDLCELNEIPL